MRDNPEKDYTHRSWIGAVALIAVLAVVSFIPPQSFGGITLRRANILSDLLPFDDGSETEREPELFDEEEFRIDMAQVAEKIEADSTPHTEQTTYLWRLGRDSIALRAAFVPDTVRRTASVVAIEDFDTTGLSPLRRFYDTLLYARRPVRIAVLGDSFIEGDIMTADLREAFQKAFGGCGAGFAPISSPLTGFRRTIKTQSKGWTAYNIMQRRSAPQSISGEFCISGWVCQPANGAQTRWEGVETYARLDRSTRARMLFISRNNSRVELTLNDTQQRIFDIAGGNALRQIVVEADSIRSLAVRIVSGADGFIGYGASFEGEGVVVDNYSVRSNNGQAMFWTNPSINAQLDALCGGYDLIVLQYGLNIMQQGVHNYTRYGAQIEKMVAFVRQCFPTAAVLVLGVSDRSTKTDAGFEPMDAVEHMLRHQRRAAQNTGAAFWSTYDAMRAEGGMKQFVANGWAGKDFTHINFAGGRRVALALYSALETGALEAFAELQSSAHATSENILDSGQRAELTRQLLEARPATLNDLRP